MEIETDSSGQRFIMVENVRITLRRPEPDKDWAGTGRYLGFRSIQASGSGLNMGADLPIRSTASDDAILTAAASVLALVNSDG